MSDPRDIEQDHPAESAVRLSGQYACVLCGGSGLVANPYTNRGSDGPEPCPACGPFAASVLQLLQARGWHSRSEPPRLPEGLTADALEQIAVLVGRQPGEHGWDELDPAVARLRGWAAELRENQARSHGTVELPPSESGEPTPP